MGISAADLNQNLSAIVGKSKQRHVELANEAEKQRRHMEHRHRRGNSRSKSPDSLDRDSEQRGARDQHDADDKKDEQSR